MALQIKTTGYEDYLDGSGNVKMLVIGGPDAGKTRSASYWPKPFYLDCENSRGSLADRRMPYVEVKNSRDALDALVFLKGLEVRPKLERQYQTVVLDTLDAFQRSVKDEWLQDTKAGTFKGYDAWGYLDTKMSMLMTRLLNLDYNVVVNAHYKDKTLKDDDGKESRELMLQLQGDIKDTAFNDFGLVGWLGSYWEIDEEEGGRVEKRGITFKKTVDKPFLKDRFNITPKWMPITFTDNDYFQIYNAFLEQLDNRDLQDSENIGVVPDAIPDRPVPADTVVAPMAGGPVPVTPPVEKPIEQMSKPELLDVVRAEGVQIKGNALKAEIIAAIATHREIAAEKAALDADTGTEDEPESDADSASPEDASSRVLTEVIAEREENTGPAVLEDRAMTVEEVAAALPATIVSDEATPEPARAAPAVLAEPADFMAGNCAQCGKPLADQTRDHVRLSFIKFRRGYLCDDDYQAARASA